MPTNVMLCRWNGGWLTAVHPDWIAQGRKEAFLSVGAAQSAIEAHALGMGQVTEFGRVREGVSVETDPADSALPYFAYNNGDTINIADSNLTLQPTRVSSISMVENDDGVITWVPEAGTLLIGEDELFDETMKAVALGAKTGTAVVTPIGR